MKNEFTPNEVREKRVKTPLKSNGRRRLCMFLALLMILGTAAVPVLPVAATVQNDAATQSRIDQVKEILNAASYDVYLKDNSDLYVSEHNQMPMGSGEIVIKPGDINSDPALTTAQGVKTADQLGKSALYLPDSGAVSFNFTVAKEGLYNLAITYLQVVGKTSAIERMLRIDGKVPFKEARYITMTKTYVDDYVYADDTDLDSNGNPKLKPASEITDFASRNLTPQFKKDIKEYIKNFNYDETKLQGMDIFDYEKYNLLDEHTEIKPNERLGEYIMLGFRLKSGIDKNKFAKLFCMDFDNLYYHKIAPFVNSGHIVKTDAGYAFSTEGMFVSNHILGKIVDF